jgi:signal transduction histidine kinase
VLEDYHFTMEAHRIRLIKDLPPISIRSDGEMLWHVFSNLVSNAIKFRGAAGRPTISVLAECRDGHVLVTVADNGIGLEPEIRDRVFDRFFQVSAVVEGSGVGLTIAKMIVEDLGGTITLASEGAGKGTSVGITLPLEGNGQSPEPTAA